MSSIAAGTTLTTALVSTGDTTGELVLKTNGGTTAVTIGTDQRVTLTGNILPAVDNTGVVGNATNTWSNGQFTNLTVDSTLNVRAAIDLADSDILRFGSSDDWEMYHNGTNNYMDLTVGDLLIRDDGTAGDPTRFTFGRTTGNLQVTGDLQFNSGYGSVATAYGCRAWVNFDGTGTVAIRASGNVTSITDNGTGDYTVNFTTAMPDANYAGAAIGALDTGGAGALVSNVSVSRTGNQSTTAFRVQTYYWAPSSNTIADFTQVQIAIFR